MYQTINPLEIMQALERDDIVEIALVGCDWRVKSMRIDANGAMLKLDIPTCLLPRPYCNEACMVYSPEEYEVLEKQRER